jgi:Domain of unknown function (DUF4349)
MRRRERQTISEKTNRELEIIDAALSGEAVADEHASLAELALAVRAIRPRPREEFVRALDARAAGGFKGERQDGAHLGRSLPSPGGRGPRGRLESGGARAVRSRPAVGLGVAAALAAATVVVALSLSGSRPSRVHQPRFTSAPAGPPVPAPAPLAGSSKHSAPGASVARASGPSSDKTGSASQPASAPTGATRQVERTATLDIGVAPGSVESVSQRVFTLVSAFSGYVRQSSVSSGAAGQSGASFDVRVPSSNLAGAIAALSHLGRVRSENDTTNDVTDQLGSLQRSLADLQAERASLLRQLAGASGANQAEVLKARLPAVDLHIARLQGTLRALSTRINYTSLALSLTSETSPGAATGDLTPGGAARDAAQILDAALAVLVLGAAALLPLAATVLGGWMIITLTRRRLREQALDGN